jgi:NTP pyrophosphatase (non-canonical NTP hydrolase)
MEKQIDLKSLQKTVDEWIKTYGVRYFDIKTNTLLLAEEVGEVARIIARTHGEQNSKESDTHQLGEELADVLFVLTCIANQSGIDLSTEIKKNIDKKTTRDAKRHHQNSKLKS